MGGDEDGYPVVAQIVDQIPHLLPMHRVESGSWFIEEKQRRIVHERATEGEQLPHAARKTASGGFALRFQVGQAE